MLAGTFKCRSYPYICLFRFGAHNLRCDVDWHALILHLHSHLISAFEPGPPETSAKLASELKICIMCSFSCLLTLWGWQPGNCQQIEICRSKIPAGEGKWSLSCCVTARQRRKNLFGGLDLSWLVGDAVCDPSASKQKWITRKPWGSKQQAAICWMILVQLYQGQGQVGLQMILIIVHEVWCIFQCVQSQRWRYFQLSSSTSMIEAKQFPWSYDCYHEVCLDEVLEFLAPLPWNLACNLSYQCYIFMSI